VGCRSLIKFYLNNAIAIEQTIQTTPIAPFAEVAFEHPNLLDVSPISGNLDYLCESFFRISEMDEFSEYAIMQTPYFLVIEAKSFKFSEHVGKQDRYVWDSSIMILWVGIFHRFGGSNRGGRIALG
jgi:hypothetical protein